MGAVAGLPTPVRALVETALRTAVRRQPESERDEREREWAAELYVLTHELPPGLRRSWAASSFAVSLAFARPIDNQHSPVNVREGFRMVLHLLTRPVAILVLAPVLLALGFAGSMIGVGVALQAVAPAEPGAGSSAVLAGAMLAILVPVMLVGAFAGRWLGRRVGARVAPGTLALLAPACLGAGLLAALMMTLLPVEAAGGILGIFSHPSSGSFAGVAAWVVVFAVTSWWTVRLMSKGRRWAAALVGGLGILLAADAAVTVFLLVRDSAVEVQGVNVALWFPLALLGIVFDLPVGAARGGADIVDLTEFYPHLLVASALFGLGYVASASRVAVRRPKPDAEPTATVESPAFTSSR